MARSSLSKWDQLEELFEVPPQPEPNKYKLQLINELVQRTGARLLRRLIVKAKFTDEELIILAASTRKFPFKKKFAKEAHNVPIK